MPGLDVLRGLAITMVLVYHGAAENDEIFLRHPTAVVLALRGFLHMGAFGVHLFFILSGFLITGILVDSRTRLDYFRTFYLRRILRIVPAYLVMLAVLRLTHSISFRYLAVCLLYFCNMTGLFGSSPEYGPLWSLSVEEQFYLFWPLVVRRLRSPALWAVSIALIVGTPLLRFALLYGPHALRDITFKTWDVMDFFAAGACLALGVRDTRLRQRLPRASAPLLVIGALLLSLLLILPKPNSAVLQRAFDSVALEPWLFLFSGLVLLAYLHPRIASLSIVQPLLFLANISYGLYLYHVFLFHLVERHWPIRPSTLISEPVQRLAQLAAETALSIAVAYVSRNTLEEFFLRLKPKQRTSAPHAKTANRIA